MITARSRKALDAHNLGKNMMQIIEGNLWMQREAVLSKFDVRHKRRVRVKVFKTSGMLRLCVFDIADKDDETALQKIPLALCTGYTHTLHTNTHTTHKQTHTYT
jgi:hypothetical protein